MISNIDKDISPQSSYEVLMGFDISKLEKATIDFFLIKISKNFNVFDINHLMKLAKKLNSNLSNLHTFIKLLLSQMERIENSIDSS